MARICTVARIVGTIKPATRITGTIHATARVLGIIVPKMRIVGALHTGVSMTGHIAVPRMLGDIYDGPYVVTPTVDKQALYTQYKHMTNDITVNAIPYFNVSNTSGGSTVYIGSEV